MNENDLWLRTEYSVMSDRLSFYLGDEKKIVTTLQYESRKEGCCHKPSFEINRNNIQCLMDDLWRAGVRPKESRYKSETITAKDNHLLDMRKIAFNKLKIGLE